ncbi:unnamed protein product [Amoebophrya sp. A120]|nr:unnamed protein product [Amoebophrya sp. A120]|eukprot:GSA120T00023531001.1
MIDSSPRNMSYDADDDDVVYNDDKDLEAAFTVAEQEDGSDITSSSRHLKSLVEEDIFSQTQVTAARRKKLALEWSHLSFNVKGRRILHDCYGKVYPGQVTALIGPSGAGKSTLMNLLAARQGWGPRFRSESQEAKSKIFAGSSGIKQADQEQTKVLSTFAEPEKEKRLKQQLLVHPGDDEMNGAEVEEESESQDPDPEGDEDENEDDKDFDIKMDLGTTKKRQATTTSRTSSSRSTRSTKITTGILPGAQILYGRKPVSFEELKSSVGYVMQQEALMETETVEEQIRFAAALRTPLLNVPPNAVKRSNCKKTRYSEENAENVLETLGLQSARATRTGALSGGQKKRVSVGVELVTRPAIVFLDEPSTGLDSYSTLRLFSHLRQYAVEQNAIVVCTVHQPSSEVFDYFDRVICMRQGAVLFQGWNGKAARAYLRENGLSATSMMQQEEQGGNDKSAARMNSSMSPPEDVKPRSLSLHSAAFGLGVTSNTNSVQITTTTRLTQQKTFLDEMHGAEKSKLVVWNTIKGFLDPMEFNGVRGIPEGVNIASWLLLLAQMVDEETAMRLALLTSRVYERTEHPVLPVDPETGRSKHLLPMLMRNSLFGGELDLFSDGNNSTTSGSTPSSNKSGSGFEPRPNLLLEQTAEIKCNLDVGLVPNLLRQKHLSEQYLRNLSGYLAADDMGKQEVYDQPPPAAGANLGNFSCQFRILAYRELTHLCRSRGMLLARLLIPAIQIFFYGIIFFLAGRQLLSGSVTGFPGLEWLGVAREDNITGNNKLETEQQWNKKLMEVFGATGQPFYTLTTQSAGQLILTIPRERVLFLREYSSGMYSITTYLLAKLSVELLVIFAQSVLLLLLQWILVGFAAELIPAFFGLLLMNSLASGSLGMFISCLVADYGEVALYIQPIFFLTLSSALSGNFRPITEIPWALRWTGYIFPTAFMTKTLDFLLYQNVENQLWPGEVSDQARDVLIAARDKRFEKRALSSEILLTNFFGLAALFVGYRVLAGIVLRVNSRTMY